MYFHQLLAHYRCSLIYGKARLCLDVFIYHTIYLETKNSGFVRITLFGYLKVPETHQEQVRERGAKVGSVCITLVLTSWKINILLPKS